MGKKNNIRSIRFSDELAERIEDLKELVSAYRKGVLKEKFL